MVYTDYKLSEKEIVSQDTVVDMQDFVDYIKSWLEKNGYGLNEKTYLALPGGKTQIKWESDKKADDYHKFIFKIKFDLKAVDEAKGKRKLTQGTVKFVYSGKIERDYDSKWSGAWRHLVRAIYDRFLIEPGEKSVLSEFKSDSKRLTKAVKTYFGI